MYSTEVLQARELILAAKLDSTFVLKKLEILMRRLEVFMRDMRNVSLSTKHVSLGLADMIQKSLIEAIQVVEPDLVEFTSKVDAAVKAGQFVNKEIFKVSATDY